MVCWERQALMQIIVMAEVLSWGFALSIIGVTADCCKESREK